MSIKIKEEKRNVVVKINDVIYTLLFLYKNYGEVDFLYSERIYTNHYLK